MKLFKESTTWVIVCVTAAVIMVAMFAIGKTEYSGNEIIPSILLFVGGFVGAIVTRKK
jgi:VIT1/CCC1 family predicted Fe2+/Mn2+ transporter